MPRQPRCQHPGETYHVTAHGLDQIKVFRTDDDRSRFVRFLGMEVRRSLWTCLAYSILGTHYHVLVLLREATLSSGFQRLNGRYAIAYNQEYARRGHVFEARFRAVLVEGERHRLEVARYIALNASRANLADSAEAYPFCDYGATIGLYGPDPVVDPAEALAPFGSDLESARRRYRTFVEEKDPRVRVAQARAGSVPDGGQARVRPPA